MLLILFVAVCNALSLRHSFSNNIFSSENAELTVFQELYLTKNTYNGTVGYEGLFNACEQEKSGSVPCTSSALIKSRFWAMKVRPAWVLDLMVNCVGYSSDEINTIGLCVQTQYGKQVIPCSCNMKISVCCF